MSLTRDLPGQIELAKCDIDHADSLIRQYMPFIRSEIAKFLHAPSSSANDDQLSIAMLAFHEAIRSYSMLRGNFLKYAALVIKSRLQSHAASLKRHQHVSMDQPMSESEHTLHDVMGDDETIDASRLATQSEIEELENQLHTFGLTMTDVTENAPRQQRSLQRCKMAIAYAIDHPQLLDELVKTRKLPLKALVEGSKVDRKTLERHRKYVMTMLLIYTNGYEIIRGHLMHMMKGVGALSIVRFRSAIKEPMDIAFLFWAISIGIILAAGLIPLALFGSIMIGLMLMVFSRIKVNIRPYILVIHCDSTMESMVETMVKTHCSKMVLKSKSIEANIIELNYEVRLKNEDTSFINAFHNMDGITMATLVSYNGDYLS